MCLFCWLIQLAAILNYTDISLWIQHWLLLMKYPIGHILNPNVMGYRYNIFVASLLLLEAMHVPILYLSYLKLLRTNGKPACLFSSHLYITYYLIIVLGKSFLVYG